MRYLYKVFRENDRGKFQKVHQDRINFDSTVSFDLSIKPIDQPNTFDLYYVPTNAMLHTIGNIYRVSNELNNTFSKLPAVARDQFIMECIVEELYNTNELEGVKSTKEEIARSVKKIRINRGDKRRFKSMIKSYLSLINGDSVLPSKPSDIRDLYDDITEDEIEPGELPDGEIFRKSVTYVLKKSGTGKVIHRGLSPEHTINFEINRLLMFMNDSKEIPLLIKVAVGHYYFGYIHPFYDGNGRTSRFISSMYLSEALGNISALSLSRGCNKFTKKYLEGFEVSNSIMNAGEMNCFIEALLNIILDTLKEMRSELKEKLELIEMALDKIKNDPDLEDEKNIQFMFVIAQNYFFHFSDGLTVKELAKILNKSDGTVRKIANELLEKSFLEQIGQRPAYFKVAPGYFQ